MEGREDVAFVAGAASSIQRSRSGPGCHREEIGRWRGRRSWHDGGGGHRRRLRDERRSSGLEMSVSEVGGGSSDIAAAAASSSSVEAEKEGGRGMGRDEDGVNERASKFFSELPAKKLLIWMGFLVAVYILRSFFPVAIGTFILAYIGNSFVQYFGEKFSKRISRRAIVATYYSLIISVVTLLGVTTIPTVVSEGQYFIQSMQSSNPYVLVADGIRSNLGDESAIRVEKFLLSSQWGGAGTAETPPPSGTAPKATSPLPAKEEEDNVWTEERSRRLGMLLQTSLRPYVVSTASIVTQLLAQTTKVLFTALLSLIFSAMIVWDLPRLSKAVTTLGRSRLRSAYEEISPYVREFFTVLGRSFEAQSMIALVNTTLSTMGMLVLGLKGVWFLSVVVLVCSFIPVAGVFVSTLPMVVVALSEYGFVKALWVVFMVIFVHAVEAYFLNPQIYSAHMKLHPLFVIVVLYVWEHLYGPPGLILAVPVTAYLLRNVVMGASSSNDSQANAIEPSKT